MSERPSAQERYDSEIASRHGGMGGFSSDGVDVWRDDSPAAQAFDDGVEFAQFAQPEEPAYEPEGYDPLDYEAEPEVDFGEEGWIGDSLEDTVRSAIREDDGLEARLSP